MPQHPIRASVESTAGSEFTGPGMLMSALIRVHYSIVPHNCVLPPNPDEAKVSCFGSFSCCFYLLTFLEYIIFICKVNSLQNLSLPTVSPGLAVASQLNGRRDGIFGREEAAIRMLACLNV